MNYCPHCHKPVAYLTGPCPHCGKNLDSLKSSLKSIQDTTERKGEDRLAEAQEEERPLDLDFDPRKARGVKAEQHQLTKEKEVGDSVSQREKKLQQEIEKEIESISGYGKAPDGWMGCVSYFLKVMGRKKDIEKKIIMLSHEYESKKKDLESDLIIIGRKKFSEQEIEKNYPAHTQTLKTLREKLDKFGEVKSLEQKEMEEKEAFLDEQLLRIHNEVEKLRLEEEAMARQVQLRGSEFKKAKMKLQRIEIEIRNYRQLLNAPTLQGDDIIKNKNRITEMEKEQHRLESELKSFQDAYDEAEKKLAFIKSSMAELQGKIAIINKRKSQMVSTLKKRVEEINQTYISTQEEYNNALCALALESLERDDLPDDFKIMKEKLVKKTKLVKDAEEKLQKFKLAKDSYSHEAFQRAYIVMGSSFILIIILALLLMVIF